MTLNREFLEKVLWNKISALNTKKSKLVLFLLLNIDHDKLLNSFLTT